MMCLSAARSCGIDPLAEFCRRSQKSHQVNFANLGGVLVYRIATLVLTVAWGFVLCASYSAADDLDQRIASSLKGAGKNRSQLERALHGTEASMRDGMRFLIAHMPDRDLKTLSASFLLENVRLAYHSWRNCNWSKQVPSSVFLNYILPYASVTERRDNWRRDFAKRFASLVKNAKTPSEAAAILNRSVFRLLKVRYSRKRRKADQSPYESIETGMASCTGLSVLLVAACRSVGVPARFVGTPLWADKSGNHSWIEVWDNGWHFTGAAEPTGDTLNRAWFLGRASKAQVNHRLHAIYAVSYRRTPIRFPIVWSPDARVHALNVTNRYTRRKTILPDGIIEVRVCVRAARASERVAAKLQIWDSAGKLVFSGKSQDERFDRNDHLTVHLKKGCQYRVKAECMSASASTTLTATTAGQLVKLLLR